MLEQLLNSDDLKSLVQQILSDGKQADRLKEMMINHFQEIKHLPWKEVTLPKTFFDGFEDRIIDKYPYPLDYFNFMMVAADASADVFNLIKKNGDLEPGVFYYLYKNRSTILRIFDHDVMRNIWDERTEKNDLNELVNYLKQLNQHDILFLNKIYPKIKTSLINEIKKILDVDLLFQLVSNDILNIVDINQGIQKQVIGKTIENHPGGNKKYSFMKHLKEMNYIFTEDDKKRKNLRPGGILYNEYIANGGDIIDHSFLRLNDREYLNALRSRDYEFSKDDIQFLFRRIVSENELLNNNADINAVCETNYSGPLSHIKSPYIEICINEIRDHVKKYKKGISLYELALAENNYPIRNIANGDCDKNLLYIMSFQNLDFKVDDYDLFVDKKYFMEWLMTENPNLARKHLKAIGPKLISNYIPPIYYHDIFAEIFIENQNLIKEKYPNINDFIISHQLTSPEYISLIKSLDPHIGEKYELAINLKNLLNLDDQSFLNSIISDGVNIHEINNQWDDYVK